MFSVVLDANAAADALIALGMDERTVGEFVAVNRQGWVDVVPAEPEPTDYAIRVAAD